MYFFSNKWNYNVEGMRTDVFVHPSLKGAAISFRKESHSKPSNLHPQVACKVYVLSPKPLF